MYAAECRLGRTGDRRGTQTQEQRIAGRETFVFAHGPPGVLSMVAKEIIKKII